MNKDGIINYEEFVKYMLSEINRGPPPRQVKTWEVCTCEENNHVRMYSKEVVAQRVPDHMNRFGYEKWIHEEVKCGMFLHNIGRARISIEAYRSWRVYDLFLNWKRETSHCSVFKLLEKATLTFTYIGFQMTMSIECRKISWLTVSCQVTANTDVVAVRSLSS